MEHSHNSTAQQKLGIIYPGLSHIHLIQTLKILTLIIEEDPNIKTNNKNSPTCTLHVPWQNINLCKVVQAKENP